MKRWAIFAAMPLAACARHEGSYPSLAHRPIEAGNFDEPVRAAPTLKPDPALDRQIATAASALADATAAFDRAHSAAEKRAQASRGKPAGSDSWVDAQQALATLDDTQARVAALSTEIETAASARAAQLLPAYPTLDALNARIDAEQTRERAAIDRLQAMLAPS